MSLDFMAADNEEKARHAGAVAQRGEQWGLRWDDRSLRASWGVFESLVILASLILHLFAASRLSVTYDEVAHLPAGWTYLVTHSVVLNREHPPLIKTLCALPLMWLDVQLPAPPERLVASEALSAQWEYGQRFLHGPDLEWIVFWGRVPAIFLGLLLLIVVWAWALKLGGTGCARFAMLLAACDPTIAAHSRLVTTDVGFAALSTVFLFVFQSHLRNWSVASLTACGLSLGLACGAKFTGVILLPLAFVLSFLWRRANTQEGGWRRLSSFVGGPLRALMGTVTLEWLALVGVAALTVWLLYFCPPRSTDYLEGLSEVGKNHRLAHPAYLCGKERLGGWWYYLPLAWLVKTPLPTLVLVALAALRLAAGVRASRSVEAFLWVPLVAFSLFYCALAPNIGVRYLIPCLPLLYVSCSRLVAPPVLARPRLKWLILSLVIWLTATFVFASPYHISYFNELSGGAHSAFKWLDDSNLDWGHGMIALRNYLAANRLPAFRFAYLSSLDPRKYGVSGAAAAGSLVGQQPPGTLIVSGHVLARAYAESRRLGDSRSNWIGTKRPVRVIGGGFYVYEF